MSRTEMAERIRRAAGHTPDSTEGDRFERASLDERTVCAVDPSVGACAWAVLQHTEHELAVRQYRTHRFNDVTSLTGRKAAARELYLQLLPELDALLSWFPDIEMVLEAPPAGKNRLLDTVSTWVAGTVAECAALQVGMPVRPLVQIQHHKKTITGMGNADKDLVDICLGLLATSLPIIDYPRRTNNNVRDAVSVGLADLYHRDTR